MRFLQTLLWEGRGFARVAAVLLLAALCGAGNVRAAETNKFQNEIDAFIGQDRTNPPPKGAILFAGSSSFRLWKTLEKDFAGYKVINRGFGGSQMSDLNHFTAQIVMPYAPRQIFVYEGDNDVAAGKSPEVIMEDFRKFVVTVKKALPETTIHFVAIKPSPSRWHLVEKTKAANKLIREFAEADSQVEFVDVFTPMLGADGKPDASLFVADNLHMNEKGYALWKQIVAPHLKK